MADRLVGRAAPFFHMKTATGDGKDFGNVRLDEFRGHWLVLFFYPLDFTFVCPTEITGFNKHIDEFRKLDAAVVGVSVDSKHSHKAWLNTELDKGGLGKLAFPLASDITKHVSKEYGVLIEEDGIALRGLFIVDPEGVVRYGVVHDLNVGRSVSETLRVLQALQAGGLCPVDWNPGDKML